MSSSSSSSHTFWVSATFVEASTGAQTGLILAMEAAARPTPTQTLAWALLHLRAHGLVHRPGSLALFSTPVFPSPSASRHLHAQVGGAIRKLGEGRGACLHLELDKLGEEDA